MVSDFVEEYDGFLCVSQETVDRVGTQCEEACQYLKIGEGRYWRSESFLKQVEKGITIFEAKYPDVQGNLHSDVNSLLTNITNGWLFPRYIPCLTMLQVTPKCHLMP